MATLIHVEVDSETLKRLVIQYMQDTLGINVPFIADKVKILVRSKQNYRVHEWEVGDFMAIYDATK